MKNKEKKEKKKAKNKKAEKELKKSRKKAGKEAKPGKLKESTKALRKEIHRLTQELQLKDDQLKALKQGGQADLAVENDLDILSEYLHESSNTGSISERKKIWERHQFLRSRYEAHLEAGQVKAEARRNADRDLRQRYGDEAGYTEEQLDSILS